ncbi:MAG: diguanylate cyclase [Rhodospirillales bacterium]
MTNLGQTTTTPELAARLAALQASYVNDLPAQMGSLKAVFQALAPGGFAETQDALKAVHQQVHTLAGTSATFGLDDISGPARQIETEITALMDAARGLDAATAASLRALHHDLTRAVEDVINVGVDGAPESDPAGADNNTAANDEDLDQPAPLSVAIVGEGEFPAFAARELKSYGYRVCHVASPAAAVETHSKQEIDVAVIDGDVFPDGPAAAAKAVHEARGDNDSGCPVVFVTEKEDLHTRLAIVRAGIEGYLPKPVESAHLIDAIDGLGRGGEAEPYRVLVVDDDMVMAEFVSAVLRDAGMIAETVIDPNTILEMMHEFAPELVLMDLYMPNCTGPEIASVIRQENAFAGVPIVFLSGEQDRTKQLNAMGFGGDDFITKPIQPPYLIKAVRTRAKRFRTINGRMIRDSLTGLYNHSTTMQFLAVETQRAERAGGAVSVAALDLDHFKNVNDTHGHAVGDRVIKALARTLSLRLRGTDIIGRTGGEEFMIIMPDTPLEQAVAVLNEIRTAFGAIVHDSEVKDFSVTLSIGVAATPPYENTQSLPERADLALYEAKRGGRNNVQTAK